MNGKTVFICTVTVCAQEFYSQASLVQHLQSHIRKGHEVFCPIDECLRSYKTISSFSSHISSDHTISSSFENADLGRGETARNDGPSCGAAQASIYSDTNERSAVFMGEQSQVRTILAKEEVFEYSTMFNAALEPNAILKVLPYLDSETLDKLLIYLSELGVRSDKDLCYIREKEYMTILTTVDARKLRQAYKRAAITLEEDPHCTNTEPLDSQNLNLHQTTVQSDRFWATSYNVPWEQFPNALMTALKQGHPAPSRERKEMVRVVVSDITRFIASPDKRSLEMIADSIVSKYPKSFQVMADGVHLSNGSQLLANSMMYRMDSIKRKMKKQQPFSSIKRARPYGHSNWCPASLSNPEMQGMVQSKKWLKQEHGKTHPDMVAVKQCMRDTFPLQQGDINKENLSVHDLKVEWPFFFHAGCLFQHYSLLRNESDSGDRLLRKLTSKAANVFGLFRQLSSKKQQVSSVIRSTIHECSANRNKRPKVNCFISLLCAHFEEDETDLYQCFPKERDINDIVDCVSTSPLVAVKGATPSSGTEFYVIIEQTIAGKFPSFLAAFTYCFCSFFVLNMMYPGKAGLTLDFIQRQYAGILECGMKKQVGAKRARRKYDIHPKVARLLGLLASFEQQKACAQK